MKPYKSKHVKTQESLDKNEESKDKKDWVFHSVLKNKKKPVTPLRFADVIQKKSKNEVSTNDKENGSTSRPARHEAQISKAINVLKDVSGRRELNNPNDDQYEEQQPKQITPFSLNNQMEDFEEQLTFKGASNRQHLLTKLDVIEKQANQIFSVVKHLNHNSSIDFITFKLFKSKQQDLKLSYYDFYSHLQILAKKVNDFVTELNRCRQIMSKIAAGISKRTMELYITKFEGLIKELKNSLSYLQNYVEILNSLQKQEKKNTKKNLMVHKCGHSNSQFAF